MLYIALKEKVIRSAWFDVLENEPPRADEHLLTLPNFYLTPHIASRSGEAERNTADIAAKVMLEALKQYLTPPVLGGTFVDNCL